MRWQVMTLEYVLVCVAVGVGTYLFRYLPARLGTRRQAKPSFRGALCAFLASVGVASVAALLAASLEPLVRSAYEASDYGAAAATMAGLTATFVLFRWRKDVALSTVLGAVVYGVVMWLLA